MAAATFFQSLTVTATGATYYATTLTAPGNANLEITGVSLSAFNATPASNDSLGVATSNANAALFAFSNGVQNLTRDFTQPVLLPAGATLYVLAQGWAVNTPLDLLVSYRTV